MAWSSNIERQTSANISGRLLRLAHLSLARSNLVNACFKLPGPQPAAGIVKVS
jgi:hypothetical protein